MKTFIATFFSLALFNMGAFAFAANSPSPAPTRVVVVPDEIFIPPGFNTNNNVQITIHGYLRNSCFRIAPSRARVDLKNHQIFIEATAYFYPQRMCADIIIYYTDTLNLGILPAGNYQVSSLDANGQVASRSLLGVAVANDPGPDDYLYLPLTQAVVDPNNSHQLILSGVFPNQCMTVQTVQVMHRVPHVIEVLPIASYTQGTNCTGPGLPFNLTVNLPTDMEPGDALIHVRSLNGQSFNPIQSF